MIKERIELTMSHVGLGRLTEASLLTLFGDGHSHSPVEGVENNPAGIADTDGRMLYPAYIMTHLMVPSSYPLSTFNLWDPTSTGSTKDLRHHLDSSRAAISRHSL